jgi:hypothetical protein
MGLKLFLIHVYSKVSPLEWIKIRCLRKAKDLKVNISSGRLIKEGWVNIDCDIRWSLRKVACDIRRVLPIPSRSVKYVFAEHGSVTEPLKMGSLRASLLMERRYIVEP